VLSDAGFTVRRNFTSCLLTRSEASCCTQWPTSLSSSPPTRPVKAGAHLVHATRIKFSQPVCLSSDEKGRLSDFGAFEGSGQIEVRLVKAADRSKYGSAPR
jgi:hypothetical protein